MSECNDERCAKHGRVKVRGNVFTGKVVSAKASKTVIVERQIVHFISKYERYKKTRSRIAAHNPECMNAKEGDIVTIGETRKLSKTKSFVVLSVEKQEEKEAAPEGREKAKEKKMLEKKQDKEKEAGKEKKREHAEGKEKKETAREESKEEEKTAAEEKKWKEEKKEEKASEREQGAGEKNAEEQEKKPAKEKAGGKPGKQVKKEGADEE